MRLNIIPKRVKNNGNYKWSKLNEEFVQIIRHVNIINCSLHCKNVKCKRVHSDSPIFLPVSSEICVFYYYSNKLKTSSVKHDWPLMEVLYYELLL